MKYVYILESLDSQHFYVGITDDLRARLAKHNAGEVPHTSKYGPWRLKTYVAFSNEQQAIAFEKYLKTASGRAFAKNASERRSPQGEDGPDHYPLYLPVNRGGRFSMKLATPSRKSLPLSAITISLLASMVASASVWNGTS